MLSARKQQLIQRNLRILERYLEVGNYEQIGREYKSDGVKIRPKVHEAMIALNSFAIQQRMPAIKSFECADVLAEKEYWAELIDRYRVWVANRIHITTNSPIDHLGLLPSISSKLFDYGIVTVGALLDRLKHDRADLLKATGFGAGKFMLIAKHLREHGYHIDGGKEQTPKC